MRTDYERAQGQQRQQQRQRWRLSQRSAVDSNDTEAQGYAGLSGDGIDGFTTNNVDANIGNGETVDNAGAASVEEPNRRRNRMSVRLQEVFGVRTSRPESAIFAGVGGEGGRGRGGNAEVTAANDPTNADGNAGTNTQMTTATTTSSASPNSNNTNTSAYVNMTLPEAPRLPPISL